MSVELDALKAEVKAMTDQVTSVDALLAGLAAQILDKREDPAALTVLANELRADRAALVAAALASETALEPVPAPVVEPVVVVPEPVVEPAVVVPDLGPVGGPKK